MSILSPMRGNSTVYEENKNEVFDFIFLAISLIVMLPIVGLSAEKSLVFVLAF